MKKKNKKLLKRIDEKQLDPLWYRLRQLENTKMLYEQNYNLLANVRMANVQLVQNDIIALKERLKKRKGFTSSMLELEELEGHVT